MAIRTTIKHLEMRLRARTPQAVRLLYRLGRSVEPIVPSKTLPEDLVRDCRLCNSRSALLELLPPGGRVAELGTLKGDFAREILARNKPKELHVIDVDYSQFDQTLLADTRLVRHQGLTDAVIGEFDDASFDWIYVDADHSYDGVAADARASAPKLKPGGFLVFNDFGQIDPFLGRYGVHRAVIDFAVKMGWPLRFFALHHYAMYDVALQKPGLGSG